MDRRRRKSRTAAPGLTSRSVLAWSPIDSGAPGTVLFSQGTPARDAFLLLEGLVRLTHRLSDGRASIVGLRGRGALLGVEAAGARRPHPLTAIAVTTCRWQRVSARDWAGKPRAEAKSWVHAARLEEHERQIVQSAGLARLSARERLEAHLDFVRAELAHGSLRPGAEVELPLRDRELAQLLAITPSYLSRLMRELEREGRLIRSGQRARIVVPADTERRAA